MFTKLGKIEQRRTCFTYYNIISFMEVHFKELKIKTEITHYNPNETAGIFSLSYS